jgi:hypothetical protein
MARVGQPNFSKGVISEELVARVDVPAYSTALRRGDNVIILKYGGVTKRPGTRLVAEVYDDDGVRLMPFQFSLEQTYAIEMGQGYARFAANGGLVLEDKLTVEGVLYGYPTTIAASYHGYEVGDQIYYSETSVPELDGRVGRVVAVPDPHTYRVDIDSTGFTTLTADSGGTIRVGAPPPPPPRLRSPRPLLRPRLPILAAAVVVAVIPAVAVRARPRTRCG